MKENVRFHPNSEVEDELDDLIEEVEDYRRDLTDELIEVAMDKIGETLDWSKATLIVYKYVSDERIRHFERISEEMHEETKELSDFLRRHSLVDSLVPGEHQELELEEYEELVPERYLLSKIQRIDSLKRKVKEEMFKISARSLGLVESSLILLRLFLEELLRKIGR